MKILLISNMYPSNKYPSYGVFVKNINNILENNNYNIKKIVVYKTSYKLLKILKYLIFYLKVMINLSFNNFDVIYVHYASHCSIPILIVSKFKKNMTIYTNVHGSDVIPTNKVQNSLQACVKRLLRISKKVITPSNYFKNLVITKYLLESDKVFVFPSGGVNTNCFQPKNREEVLKKLKFNSQYKYIGYVGRIEHKKGWKVFLEAIKLLKDNDGLKNKKIIMVGNGKELQLFNNYVRKNGLSKNIIKFDLLSQKQLADIYNCLDIFCFPTKGESLGLVGLEAMACGVPVIGSNIEALKEYINDGINGKLFEVGDNKSLAKNLLEYFNLNSQKKIQMKKQAELIAKKYDSKLIEKKLTNLF